MDSAKIEELAEQVPIKYRGTYRKALMGNRPAAVRAKCQDCVGYEDTVSRIRECECVECPLHAIRPYQVKRVIKLSPKDASQSPHRGTLAKDSAGSMVE